MDDVKIRDLIEALPSQGEGTATEAKAASQRLPEDIAATLSAFANTPGGGLLLLGVDERANFAVVGVADAQQIQHNLASIARDALEPPLQPTVTAVDLAGKTVVAAEIAELPRAEKPCYVRSKGINRGSFLRVANSTRRLTSEEVQQLLADRGQPRFDREIVDDASISDLDQAFVNAYIARLRHRQPTVFEPLDDEALLQATHVIGRGSDSLLRPTVAGLLAMGRFPQTHLPQLNITFVHYPTINGASNMGEVRFIDNARFDGPIPAIVRDCLGAIARNMTTGAVVEESGRRDVWEYPLAALRELVANAVIHRDLSPGSRGTHVQVEMYPDRLRVVNPGGLFGSIDVSRLGESGVTSARNADLLRILEDVVVPTDNRPVAENRGSGIRVVRRTLADAGMPAPEFHDRATTFDVVLRPRRLAPAATHTASAPSERADRSHEILAFVRSEGTVARADLVKHLGITQPNASYWLGKLRKADLIEPVGDVKGPNVRYRLRNP